MSRTAHVVLLVLAAGAITCAPAPRFGSLRFGPRELHLQTRGEVLELESGLRVALLPDDRTNLVRVDVRYRAGAAEDPLRRSGMAHLIEHLSFEMRPAPGAPSVGEALVEAALVHNAYTTHDVTHYYEIGLASRLPLLIEIEAQRMEPRCDLLDEGVFLRERDVVLEEEAERRDLAEDDATLLAKIWGPAHPYARAIGSREIAGATLAEACAFVDDHHAPDRATLVVTGNFDLPSTKHLIAERLGRSTRHSRRTRTAIELPALLGDRDEVVVETESEQETKWIGVVLTFPASLPSDGDAAMVAQEVAAAYLPSNLPIGMTRHHRRPRVWFSGGERAALVHVQVDVLDGGDLETGEVVDAVITGARKLGKWGLGGIEVDRSEWRNRWLSAIDGFAMRGQIAAQRLAFSEPADMFEGRLRAIDAFTIDDLRAWSSATMDLKRSRLTIIRRVPKRGPAPAGRIASATGAHDLPTRRLAVDPAEAERALSLPVTPAQRDVDDYTLPNGLRVVLAPLPGALTVEARLVFPIGDAGTKAESQRADFAAYALMDDYSPPYEPYHVERIDWVFGLGTLTGERVSDRATTFTAAGAALFADWHVWRLFWRLDTGVYPERGIQPTKGRRRDELERRLRRIAARTVHDRVLSEVVFGPGHFWLDQLHLDGSVTHAQLEAYRRAYYTPTGATLIVSGGFDRAEMRTHVGELFTAWRARPAPESPKTLPIVDPIAPVWVALPDREGRQVRATIAIGGLPRDVDGPARAVLVEMLGDRVRAVREQQGASYGVHVEVETRGDRAAFVVDGNLDPERAGRALRTMLDAVATLEAGGPGLAADFVRARSRVVARALADGGGAGELADELEEAVRRKQPLELAGRRAQDIANVTLADVSRVAVRDLASARRVVVVSGPAETARAALIAAGVPSERIVIDRPKSAP